MKQLQLHYLLGLKHNVLMPMSLSPPSLIPLPPLPLKLKTSSITPITSSRLLCKFKDSDMISQLEILKPEGKKPEKNVNGVFWILLLNLGIYVADHVFQVRAVKALYLYHNRPAWYQFVTATFCHFNWNHLSSNLFFLYIFGKLVEEEEGNFGLWLSYILTGAGANLVSWLILPRNAVSVGASGAVFGLFAISVLVKMSWDWRKILEVLVLGQFVIERVMEAAQASTGFAGGIRGGSSALQNVNHIAHLSGALIGVALIWMLSGISSELLSSVWKEWIKWCIEFGIEANAIIAVPYDWRLSPSKLEERDLYFHKLKLTFETALKLRGGPSIVFAHSLGNNVFRYFLEWLKLEIAPKEYKRWLDDHIHAYFAVGAPLLGAIETVKATLSGATFGLPVSEGTARLMFNTFGSSLWMLPFSKYCTTDNVYRKHFSGGNRKTHHAYHCDENELQSKYSGWPTNIINIEVPSIRGNEAYPSFVETAQTNMSGMECGFPMQLSFSAREVSDGTFFKAIKDYDSDSERLLHILEKCYHEDPIFNPLTPWERPPLKNIFCIYGVDSKTEVGYYFAPSGKPYPDNWIITDVIYEIEGSLYSRSGNLVEGNPGATSGDETVPYHSLSWCKNWLGPKVNITRTPQSEHDGSDVQVHQNIDHQHGEDIFPNMTKSPTVKYITYYEDSESSPGTRTAVWELDKANHRNIVRSPVLMRELWLEMWHDIHPDKKSKFVTKAKRGPLRDEDCYWDYGKARCAWPEHCEYRYLFGDVHLGQSCRLKNSSSYLLSHYV